MANLTLTTVQTSIGCREGHVSVLCFTCRDGYKKDSAGLCVYCSDPVQSRNLMLYVLITILVVAVLAVAMRRVLFVYYSKLTDYKDHMKEKSPVCFCVAAAMYWVYTAVSEFPSSDAMEESGA